MWLKRTLPGLLAVVTALGGCGSVTVRPADVIVTNARNNSSGAELSGAPLSEAADLGKKQASTSAVGTPYGDIHVATALSTPASDALIVFCGGNGFQERYAGATRGAALAPFGDILMFDYPGLGQSGGSGAANEYQNFRQSLGAYIAELVQANGYGEVIFWGHSFGSGFCSALAADHKGHSRLVLEAGFGSLMEVARARAGAAANVVQIEIDPAVPQYGIRDLLRGYSGQVVSIASRADEVIPFAVSQALANDLESANGDVTVLVLPEGTHARLWATSGYRPALERALGR
nr:alpha/beta fold hydrolase [uncultured Brevundimonas sp.]